MKNILLLLLSLNIYSQTIESYFEIPKNYKRIIQNDYHSWIISKNINTKDHVKYFSGQIKKGFNKVYVAKFVYDIGNKDLHQWPSTYDIHHFNTLLTIPIITTL